MNKTKTPKERKTKMIAETAQIVKGAAKAIGFGVVGAAVLKAGTQGVTWVAIKVYNRFKRPEVIAQITHDKPVVDVPDEQ